MTKIRSIKLNSGLEIPTIGLGTWQIEGSDAVNSVKEALKIGYRHIDTADAYYNHKQVGQGIKESGVNRDEIFLTTKVWRENLTKSGVLDSVSRFLTELETDYIDLLLIHWPNRNVAIAETLSAMQQVQKEGLVRSIGVSNFTIHHLQEAMATGVQFSVNQVEFHPLLNQTELKNFCDKNGIVLTAYSPLARGQALKLDEIVMLTEKYGKTPSQIILNWLMSKDIVVIPASKKPEHIADNLKATDFELEKEDRELLERLGSNKTNQTRLITPDFNEFDY